MDEFICAFLGELYDDTKYSTEISETNFNAYKDWELMEEFEW